MHLILIFGFEFLQHFGSFGDSGLGVECFLGPDALRHLLFDFFVDFFFAEDLHPLGRANQNVGLLFIIFSLDDLQIHIQILDGVELFSALEYPIDILKLTQLE